MTAVAGTGYALPRWALITFGVLSVVAGVLALVWPGVTILVLVMLLGIDLLIYGAVVMAAAFQSGQGRVLAVIFGVLAFIAGTSLFLRPMRNLGVLLIVLSVFWMVGGLVQAIGSLVERDEHWVLELFSGLLSLVAGIVVLAWPGMTLFAIAVTAGIWMIAIGLLRIWAGFSRPSATPAVAV